MNIPEDLKYSKDHEWVRVSGDHGTTGVTDYAQGELGDVVYVDLNDSITEFNTNDTLGTIEAVKTVSDILAPVSGVMIEVHHDLNDNPELVNTDPYGEGWMVKYKITNPAELNDLMNAAEYKAYIGQ